MSVSRGKLFPKSILIILFLMLVLNLQGQIIEIDTTQHLNKIPVNAEEIHSPKKATLYSAILPGLGQAYNKKYWKVPLVYIGFGTIGYFMDWNNGNYQFLKKAYQDLSDLDENTNSFLEIPASKGYDLNNPTSLKNFKTAVIKQQDYYRRNRDLLFISLFGFYGINLIDASVDAHFFDFDISEDLTFNWQPSMQYFDNQTVYCINCTLNF